MILITGATGIVGRMIALYLLQQGEKVRACKRPTSDIEEVRQFFRCYTDDAQSLFQKIEWVEVDFQDMTSLENALQGITQVYHTAAVVSFDPKYRAEMNTTNIIGTQNLLYACQSASVEKFCHISSIAVFDGVNEQGEIDETCDYNPKINHSDYAMSKHFSEMEVWRASAEGLNAVILNPGVIIGSGNWKKSSGILFDTALRNDYTFSGGTSYIDVRDVAKIAIQLMNKNIFGQRFALVAESWTYKTFADSVRKRVGKAPTKLLPKFLISLLPLLRIFLGAFIPKLRMATRSNMQSVTTFNTISNQKIKNTLSYEFISIEESIQFHLKNYTSQK